MCRRIAARDQPPSNLISARGCCVTASSGVLTGKSFAPASPRAVATGGQRAKCRSAGPPAERGRQANPEPQRQQHVRRAVDVKARHAAEGRLAALAALQPSLQSTQPLYMLQAACLRAPPAQLAAI